MPYEFTSALNAANYVIGGTYDPTAVVVDVAPLDTGNFVMTTKFGVFVINSNFMIPASDWARASGSISPSEIYDTTFANYFLGVTHVGNGGGGKIVAYAATGSRAGNLLWISSGSTTTVIQTAIGSDVNSNILGIAGKVWFTAVGSSSTSNVLYCYDMASRAQIYAIAIPTTPTVGKDRCIAYGNNGFIYISNWNDGSVSKHRESDGVLIANILIGNREVNRLAADGAGHVYVSSRLGLISMIDTTTDVVTHPWTTLYEAPTGLALSVSGAHLWFTTDGASLGRLQLSDSSTIYNDADDDDYLLSGITVPANTTLLMCQSPQTTTYTGVAKYILVVMNTNYPDSSYKRSTVALFIDDNATTLCSTNTMAVSGVGMLSQGTYDYTGD